MGRRKTLSGLVVADADALVALTLEGDPLHKKAVEISRLLESRSLIVVFPVTVFPEASTFLKRALNQTEKAHKINHQLQKGAYSVQYLDKEILARATYYFDRADSKKNTFFDAIVAACAQNLKADAIFSFDEWYPKLGFKLASELKN